MKCRICSSLIEKRTIRLHPLAFKCFPCIHLAKENAVREANQIARATGNRKDRRKTLAPLRRAKELVGEKHGIL